MKASLHFLDRGVGQPVIFLHGLGADHRVWRHQTSAFTDEYRCVAPDIRGAGRSLRRLWPSASCELPDYADDVAELCARLDIRNAHVVGQSMGGIIAQQLAFRHPALVRTLTLVGTSCHAVPPHERPIGPVAAIARASGMTAVAEYIIDLVYTKEFQRTNPEDVKAFVDVVAACDPDDVVDKLRATADLDHRALLPDVTVPALVVAGAHDGVLPPAHSELLARLLPNSELVLFGDSGHQPHVDRPAEFNRLLRRFLGGHRERLAP
jgi:pimeloyl-ACP methyl ester carboxylesterase